MRGYAKRGTAESQDADKDPYDIETGFQANMLNQSNDKSAKALESCQVTTDDEHVVYNIDLTVYKIEEKNISMKVESKLKLNSVFKNIDISSLSDDVWEISNPKVAKIVNGEIVSLQKGETDIVATINGVKYIYHLTVSDTLVSKEIKVPITGKSIKLWIVIVVALLLSVIGVCIYMLLKSKKAE